MLHSESTIKQHICVAMCMVFLEHHTYSTTNDNIDKHFVVGSFRVRSTNFLLNLRDPPPISMKFGTFEDNA